MAPAGSTLDELKALVEFLRAAGVTKYEGLLAGAPVKLELGAPLPQAPKADPLQAARPLDRRSSELQAALDRLDPRYSDPALFAIAEGSR
jgi:hypothetical protein